MATRSVPPPDAVRPEATGLPFELPEPLSYRLKRRLLGPPLVTEQLSEERLGKPTALGVLSPDCISSTAYGTEEMLRILVPAVGIAAFSLIIPVTVAVIVVLTFVTMSYFEVVQVYTKAGGSYVVARENFGVRFAQIGAVALIIDYTVTVAVQTAAGTEALTSAFPRLVPYDVPITIAVVLIIFYGNLRGIREAGRSFAIPTYLFIVAIGALISFGLVRDVLGQLHAVPIHHAGVIHIGTAGSGLLLGASLFIVLRAFANGGSSLTGLEAISNGVSAFRPPEGRNAQITLVTMSTILGTLVLGVSYLAHVTHAIPYISGAPTVLAQEARDVFGSSVFGRIAFYFIQFSTMAILYTGANTSFNGFPYLASFVAEDGFLPKQLTKRGHRLAFSNGIIVLMVVAVALLLVTRARVDALVGVYAIGVFTGFTLAGAGMVRHHLRHRPKGYRHKVVINGSAAVLSGIVVIVFAVTKFTEGAWIVIVLFPILTYTLIRLHREYVEEGEELAMNAPKAIEAPVLRRHVALVFISHLDLASARTLQYARALVPDELRAIHVVLDSAVATELQHQWARLGLSRFPLDLVECPDRRLGRVALELVAEAASDGETEVSVLLPRRVFRGAWQRILHDRTADRIASVVAEVPNCNATIVPFPVGKARRRVPIVPWSAGGPRGPAAVRDELASPGTTAPPGSPATPGSPALPTGDREAPPASRVPILPEEGPKGAGLPGEPGARSAEAPPVESPAATSEAVERSPVRRSSPASGVVPVSGVRSRQRAQVIGRVRRVTIQPGAGVVSLECTLVDDSGQLLLVFQGRRRVPGIEPGVSLLVEGMVGERQRRQVMINPRYTILDQGRHDPEPDGSDGE